MIRAFLVTRRRALSIERLESRQLMSANDASHPTLPDSLQEDHVLPHAEALPLDHLLDVQLDFGQALRPSATTYALNRVPRLNGLPGAAATLYLDFDGHFDRTWGAYDDIATPAYDLDGDPTSFNSNELAAIRTIWKYVAEDFAPFQINVSTIAPRSFADRAALRVVIGGDGLWMGDRYGGVGYLDSFTNRLPNSVYVFPENLAGGSPRLVGDVASHEAGHAFGLEHQSQYNARGRLIEEYYAGLDDARAPIMGDSYVADRGVWWRGSSAISARSIQDDISRIARGENGFGYRLDDHGNSSSLATQPAVSNNRFRAAGVIATTKDRDWFSFTTGAGKIRLSADLPAEVNNLDVKLELRDELGRRILSAAPTNSYEAAIESTLRAGKYYVVVYSQGAYGDVGQYVVNGRLQPLAAARAARSSTAIAMARSEVILASQDVTSGVESLLAGRSSTSGGSKKPTLKDLSTVQSSEAVPVRSAFHLIRAWAMIDSGNSRSSNRVPIRAVRSATGIELALLTLNS